MGFFFPGCFCFVLSLTLHQVLQYFCKSVCFTFGSTFLSMNVFESILPSSSLPMLDFVWRTYIFRFCEFFSLCFLMYRSAGNTWTCYVTLRLHVPTDVEKIGLRYVTLLPKMPTSIWKKNLVTLRNDVICPCPFLKNRYVTKRRNMPMSKHGITLYCIRLHCIRLHCLLGSFCENWSSFCVMLLHAELRLRCNALLFLCCRSDLANLAWRVLRSNFTPSFIFSSV